MIPLHKLHTPIDVDYEAERWGANCGPAALAATLGTSVAAVRDFCEPWRGYMGVPQMAAALHKAHRPFDHTPLRLRIWAGYSPLLMLEMRDLSIDATSPVLLLLGWDGPWRDVPRAAATYRHWIAVAHDAEGPYVYDVDVSWTPLKDWCETVVPTLLPKRATGGFTMQWGAKLR